ncbi:MAG: hypothetical protein ACPGWR_09700 [Ardenticatenaceae bacterium]
MKNRSWFHIVILLLATALVGCNTSSSMTSVVASESLSDLEANASPESLAALSFIDTFPLAVGSTWVYNVTVHDYSIEAEGTITESGLVTEKITQVGQQGEGWIFQAEMEGLLLSQWLGARHQSYILIDKRLYNWLKVEGDWRELISSQGKGYESKQMLTWPLEVGQEWGDPEKVAAGEKRHTWFVSQQADIETPAGTYPNCYIINFKTNPSHQTLWFCPNIGIVRKEFSHDGALHNEIWELERFSDGR